MTSGSRSGPDPRRHRRPAGRPCPAPPARRRRRSRGTRRADERVGPLPRSVPTSSIAPRGWGGGRSRRPRPRAAPEDAQHERRAAEPPSGRRGRPRRRSRLRREVGVEPGPGPKGRRPAPPPPRAAGRRRSPPGARAGRRRREEAHDGRARARDEDVVGPGGAGGGEGLVGGRVQRAGGGLEVIGGGPLPTPSTLAAPARPWPRLAQAVRLGVDRRRRELRVRGQHEHAEGRDGDRASCSPAPVIIAGPAGGLAGFARSARASPSGTGRPAPRGQPQGGGGVGRPSAHARRDGHPLVDGQALRRPVPAALRGRARAPGREVRALDARARDLVLAWRRLELARRRGSGAPRARQARACRPPRLAEEQARLTLPGAGRAGRSRAHRLVQRPPLLRLFFLGAGGGGCGRGLRARRAPRYRARVRLRPGRVGERARQRLAAMREALLHEPGLRALVQQGFAHRRKALPRSLGRGRGGAGRARPGARRVEALGRTPAARAEELAPEEWRALYEAMRA